MNNSTIVIRTAIASLLAVGVSSGSALAAKDQMEKCTGIVKAGRNDCRTSARACAAQSKTNGGKDEGVYLPRGACEQIIAGIFVVKK